MFLIKITSNINPSAYFEGCQDLILVYNYDLKSHVRQIDTQWIPVISWKYDKKLAQNFNTVEEAKECVKKYKIPNPIFEKIE